MTLLSSGSPIYRSLRAQPSNNAVERRGFDIVRPDNIARTVRRPAPDSVEGGISLSERGVLRKPLAPVRAGTDDRPSSLESSVGMNSDRT